MKGSRQLVVITWLTAVWVMLWGDLSVANVLAGAILGTAIARLLPLPDAPFPGRLRPWPAVRLVGWFLLELVRSSIQVAVVVLRPRLRPRSAVIGVRMRSGSDLYLTFTAQIASLLPGSLVVEANRATGTLYLHILDVRSPEALAAAHDAVVALEARVLRVLASEDELRDVGLLDALDARPQESGGAR